MFPEAVGADRAAAHITARVLSVGVVQHVAAPETDVNHVLRRHLDPLPADDARHRVPIVAMELSALQEILTPVGMIGN
jgi:hypothetical protein